MDTSKVNRLEIIDHRTCTTCKGEMWIHEEGKKPYECPACQGMGVKGREVVVAGPAYGLPENTTVELLFQDNNRTLKVVVSDKPVMHVEESLTVMKRVDPDKPAMELEGVTGLEELSLNEE